LNGVLGTLSLLLDTPLEPLLRGEKPAFEFLAPQIFESTWAF
jgi:hypothetical protein